MILGNQSWEQSCKWYYNNFVMLTLLIHKSSALSTMFQKSKSNYLLGFTGRIWSFWIFTGIQHPCIIYICGPEVDSSEFFCHNVFFPTCDQQQVSGKIELDYAKAPDAFASCELLGLNLMFVNLGNFSPLSWAIILWYISSHCLLYVLILPWVFPSLYLLQAP